MIIQDQFYTIQNLQSPLIHKPVTGQELFFAVSYSKPALKKKVARNFRKNMIKLNQEFIFFKGLVSKVISNLVSSSKNKTNQFPLTFQKHTNLRNSDLVHYFEDGTNV